MASINLATPAETAWAQQQVIAHHYLHKPVDARCRVMAYIIKHDATPLGCLIFGRPESTRCYDGGLTYGSQHDVAAGRARYDRWEIVNLARVWLDPRLQAGGDLFTPNAATWAIGAALRRVVSDYLIARPPCFLDEPWKLRVCLSYCDTRIHQGTIYRAAGFQLARANRQGIETWYRPLRGLQGCERKTIELASHRSQRSQQYRAARYQEALPL